MLQSSKSFVADPTSAVALRSDAIRQTATLRAASVAIAHAPTIDDCAAAIERAREALEQLERSMALYEELHAADLSTEIEPWTATLPVPDSWLDAVVGQLVLGLAERVELLRRSSSTGSSHRSNCDVAAHTEHVEAARAALRELSASRTEARISSSLLRWLPVALATLDEATQLVYLAALRRDAASLGFALNSPILAA
jgi:hypothetical protein